MVHLHSFEVLFPTFAGARLAIDLVNADNTTLPSHELALIVNDTQCRADLAMNNFINLMLMQDHSFKILGILGGCPCIWHTCIKQQDICDVNDEGTE